MGWVRKNRFSIKIVLKQIEEHRTYVNILQKSYFYTNCLVGQNKHVFA